MAWVRAHVRPLRLRPGQRKNLYVDLSREVYAVLRVGELHLQTTAPTKLHAGFVELNQQAQVGVRGWA